MELMNSGPLTDCGRTVDQVWAGMEKPPDPHTALCPTCAATRRNLDALAAATVFLREQDARHPALRAPRSLVGAVLDAARSEVRRGQRLTVASSLRGRIDISEQAVAAVVREAAAQLPGIRARRCRIDLLEDSPAGLRIHLRTAVAPGVEICAAMDLLRSRIREAVGAGIGLLPHTVHLTVEDLYDD